MQSSSIFCVYRCLLSYNNLVGKLKKHTQVNLPIDQIPITFTFNLALTNLYMPDKQSYLIINKIRDVLTYYNSTLIDPGEIECNELIKYIIGKMSLETNHNRTCDSPYLFTQEDDPSSFNRDSMMKKYLLAVLVDNKPGVLTHVSGLISRRAFNIESISAGYTEEESVTRINIVVSVESKNELDQEIGRAHV